MGKSPLSLVTILIVNRSAFKGLGDPISDLSLPGFKVQS